MDFRILGPFEVRDGDRPVDLGGDKQRAVLAILLLHPNEVVSADRLIDDLWGERPPPTALKTLQVYISRARKALENHRDPLSGSPNGLLVTRGRGYLLRVEPDELDLDRFRGLLEQGREALAAGDPERAARILRAGLALWRGPPLADFAYEPFAQSAIAQLEELRLGALEERVEADLALGRERELVGELADLVEQDPLRERLRGQLMVALYRSGRQAEALEVYQRFRQALSEQLGLDPGPGLQELEVAILNRDASLAAPVNDRPPVKTPASEAAHALRPVRRRWLSLAVAGSIMVAIAAIAAVALSGGGASALPSVIASDSVGAINPTGDTIVAAVPIGVSPSGLAAGDHGLWASNSNDNTVSRIDPATHAVVQTIAVDSGPSGIAAGADAVWVANSFSGTVSRIDPAVNRVVQTIPVGNAPSGVAFGFDSVWVTNSSDGTLSRIDAVSGAVEKMIPLGGGATDVAAGLDGVWVSDEASGRVLRVDPRINQPTAAVTVGTGPTAIAVGFGSVWVANSLDGTVSRINPRTNAVIWTIPVGSGAGGIAVGAGGVWVANEFAASVSRINPATNAVAATIHVGSRPHGMAIAGGLVWVGAQPAGNNHRGGTLTVMQQAPYGSTDPGVLLQSGASILTIDMINDGLTAFNQVGGSAGGQVVPDLATSVPAPTDGGTTYTFRLRPGIRYSNGTPVRPEDFRRAIERAFNLSGIYAAYFYGHLVGAAACVARPERCDLRRGIVTDDAAGTITFHLTSPDPLFRDELALTLAVAVPAATPNHDLGAHPPPATGPYEIASISPREVKLVRNPYFHEWSHAARPDGYPDQIIWRIGASTETAVTAIEHDSADWTIDPPPADRLGELQTRFASRLYDNPDTAGTLAMWLNTRVAPFNDVRVRRALSYAIDRGEVARVLGQDAHPTCQLLAPYVPGYRRYCPYTLNPNRAGVWSAPDLAKARGMIAASRTRGMRITLWSAPGYVADFTTTARYIASLLDRLGYRARVKAFAVNGPAFARCGDPRTRCQLAFSDFEDLFPDATEDFAWLNCQGSVPVFSLNWAQFCDPRLAGLSRRALAAEGANSPAATQLWAEADRLVTDQAPIVSLVTPRTIDFVSTRVRNYQYNVITGITLDQLWVR
jgi:YVTN family beta-propeller protein